MTRLFLLLAAFAVAFSIPPKKKIKVYLIGDSTMCEYEPQRAPLTGWGMPFQYFFDSSVTIANHARGGRSTRTFLSENRWQPIADNLQEGDYVLMQFGHNDEAKEERYKDRYTPVPDYKANLAKFITETRAKKAIPVLITPVTRMRFQDGKQVETHTEYTAAVFEVGKGNGVPVVDLDKMSRELLNELGPQLAKHLFMQLEPGEHPAYPEGLNDNTHFNAYGARRMAQLVLTGLKQQNIDLAERIVNRGKKKPAQLTAGLTGIPDTSFSVFSDYKKNSKNYPFIKPVTVAALKGVTDRRNLVYCQRGDRKLLLDAFFPAARSSKNRPAVLIIHGGGWRSGDRTHHYPLAQRLATKGYVCFTPEYRLSTEALYPAAVHDLKAALRWMHANARMYNIDTAKIAVLGFSAGGELAAFLGATNGNAAFEGEGCNNQQSSDVDAVVDMDGTLSFVHPESGEGDDSKRISAATYWFGYAKKDAPELWTEASPLTHVGRHTPPTLFINSSVDRMHAGRDDFMKVLKEHNIYTDVKTFADAPHTFPLYDPWFEPTLKYIDDFLKKVFLK
ncbi:MAG TPA: alpha/beta hydrolase fold domain-containing protein [Flavisolibacter sp.]|jgi:pectinesterase|nr:alpha/beta hydrolase fold domain-containing protein [Flavisolibacter sp.]